MIVGNFTDDTEYFCNSEPLLEWFQLKMLEAPFKITWKGKTNFIVGCSIQYDEEKDTTSFSMEAKLVEMGQKYPIDKFGHLDTPITEVVDKSQIPTDPATIEMMKKQQYREILGSCNWIVTNVAPWAVYAQNRLASVAHCPSVKHLKALRKYVVNV